MHLPLHNERSPVFLPYSVVLGDIHSVLESRQVLFIGVILRPIHLLEHLVELGGALSSRSVAVDAFGLSRVDARGVVGLRESG